VCLRIFAFCNNFVHKFFLENWLQRVNYCAVLSNPEVVPHAFPQGSIVGPTLFLMFINDLALTWKTDSGLYADDATLVVTAFKIYNYVFNKISTQLQTGPMQTASVHPDKTKKMIIGSRQIKINHLQDKSLSLVIDGHTISQSYWERLLGVHIDSNLTCSKHVENLRKNLIAVFSRSKKYIPTKYRTLLFNASFMEYCLSNWGSCDADKLDTIFKLQKRCARMILDSSNNERSCELFKRLEWYPIDKLCIKRRLDLLIKIDNKRTPKLETFKRISMYSTRSRNIFYLPYPRTNNLKRSFFYNAIFQLDKLNITQDTFTNVKNIFLESISYTNDNLSVSRIY